MWHPGGVHPQNVNAHVILSEGFRGRGFFPGDAGCTAQRISAARRPYPAGDSRAKSLSWSE